MALKLLDCVGMVRFFEKEDIETPVRKAVALMDEELRAFMRVWAAQHVADLIAQIFTKTTKVHSQSGE